MQEVYERELTLALSMPTHHEHKVNGVYPLRDPIPGPAEVNQYLRAKERGDGLLQQLAYCAGRVPVEHVLRWQRDGSMCKHPSDGRWFQRYRYWVLSVREADRKPLDEGDVVRAAGRLD